MDFWRQPAKTRFVRDYTRQGRRMEKSGRHLKNILADLRYSAERSTMFWWFVENHDAIVESTGGQRIAWVTMSTRLAELGLTDRNGRSPRPHTARITWQRARKAVAVTSARSVSHSSDSPASRAMPRSPDVQPHLVEQHDQLQSNQAHGPAPAFVMSSIPTTPPDATGSVQVSHPHDQTLGDALAQPGTSVSTAPVWTPEQIAHRDWALAKARARLAHTDRFLNIRE